MVVLIVVKTQEQNWKSCLSPQLQECNTHFHKLPGNTPVHLVVAIATVNHSITENGCCIYYSKQYSFWKRKIIFASKATELASYVVYKIRLNVHLHMYFVNEVT